MQAAIDGTDEVSAGERWFVAATLPHKEGYALENLRAQSFQAFCPLQKTVVRHARKIRTERRPVFRGYVFLSLDPRTARWRSVNGTRGVRMLISDRDGPIPVRPGVVETLMRSVGPDGLLRFAEQLKPGDPVRLWSGPFANELGAVERLDDNGRIQLLLGMFGRVVRLSVDRTDVLPVTAGGAPLPEFY